jgi:hypothetical protein
MKLTCASCSGGSKLVKYDLKKFPSFEELCSEGLENKVTLRCVAEKTFGETLESLIKKNIYSKIFSCSRVKTNWMLSGQVIFYFVFQLEIVEQEVVRSHSFTGLENRMLSSRLCFHIRRISVSMPMPPWRQPLRAVFLHWHATIVSAVRHVSSLISHRGSFLGEAVVWFLTPSIYTTMDAWNVTATLWNVTATLWNVTATLWNVTPTLWNVTATLAIYFLVTLLIQTDQIV